MVVKGGLARYKERLIREYMNVHCEEHIRMDELYRIADLSKSHFHKAFMATFGVTPTEYINRRRVGLACQRLEETDEPLTQIALDCGYADHPHFGRRFLKVTGLTPRQWRMEYGHLVKHLPQVRLVWHEICTSDAEYEVQR
jgi:AraC family transcriptional regulator